MVKDFLLLVVCATNNQKTENSERLSRFDSLVSRAATKRYIRLARALQLNCSPNRGNIKPERVNEEVTKIGDTSTLN